VRHTATPFGVLPDGLRDGLPGALPDALSEGLHNPHLAGAILIPARRRAKGYTRARTQTMFGRFFVSGPAMPDSSHLAPACCSALH
jgi:hypothetical protein